MTSNTITRAPAALRLSTSCATLSRGSGYPRPSALIVLRVEADDRDVAVVGRGREQGVGGAALETGEDLGIQPDRGQCGDARS